MNDASNPFESPHAPSGETPAKPTGFRWKPTLVEILLVLGILAVLVALLLPARRGASIASRRMQSSNNLKQIGIALHNYHDTYGSLPPAVVTDAQGRKLYSWRVLLLPFLDQNSLYEQFDLSQPWDSEQNKPLLEKMPYDYRSPFSDSAREATHTPYLAIVDAKDEQTAMLPAQGRSFDEITDGLRNTAVVVDDPAHPIPWTAPHDRDPWELLGRATFDETDLRGIQLLLADGSVHFYSDNGRPMLIGCMFCDDDRLPHEEDTP